jgi:hypothetical protein
MPQIALPERLAVAELQVVGRRWRRQMGGVAPCVTDYSHERQVFWHNEQQLLSRANLCAADRAAE